MPQSPRSFTSRVSVDTWAVLLALLAALLIRTGVIKAVLW